MIELTAQCDGHSCSVRMATTEGGNYPHEFIVFELLRRGEYLGWPDGKVYGFCSGACLSEWARVRED
jgi:hypothetical protein